MPTSPLSLCVVTGCPVLVPHGRCTEHAKQGRREADKRRPNANARGYDSQWRDTRRAYLDANPSCISCGKPATDVDHIEGHGPKGPRGHNWSSLQALCRSCHSRKTATQDGGFGHSFPG